MSPPLPSPPETGARVVSVNVGRRRPVRRGDRTELTAIVKTPVAGPVAVRAHNLAGDEQGDRENHGGEAQAVLAYAQEDLDWWAGELGRVVPPGLFGENLTVSGLDVSGALVGERWRVGSTVLEVTSPRIPCWKLGLRMEDPAFVKRFGDAGRPGAYLRIIEPGEVAAGDPVELLARPPGHQVTVALISHVRLSAPAEAGSLLVAPALPEAWRLWATRQAERHASA